MRLLELYRVMTKSLGLNSLDWGIWESVLDLEQKRKQRVAEMPVSDPKKAQLPRQ
jgi:hypothetical protein